LQKRTRSILDELENHIAKRDREKLIESRASNVIAGAINLINYIRENYDTTVSEELERRLLNSIRSQDPKKFVRGIRKASENET
jgi:hypothetical protein